MEGARSDASRCKEDLVVGAKDASAPRGAPSEIRLSGAARGVINRDEAKSAKK